MALAFSLIARNCLWYPFNTRITTNTQLETREKDKMLTVLESCQFLVLEFFLYKYFILTNINP